MTVKPIPLVLCADDYAMSPGVSEAICRLLNQGRLSATSCMTVSPLWAEHAVWLKPLRDRADIGLHLTLTEEAPLGPMASLAPHGQLPSLQETMRAALFRRLDPAEVATEVWRQIDAFEDAFGAPPDFVDGHQHVHQLPVIREAVIAALRQRLGGRAYVRTCWDTPAAILRRGIAVPKTLLIAGLGMGFRRSVRRHALRTNRSFRGVYDFSGRVPYATLFDGFLRDLLSGTLVMCHPGLSDARWQGNDVIAAQRRSEFDFFRSDALADALARRGAVLAPFSLQAGEVGGERP